LGKGEFDKVKVNSRYRFLGSSLVADVLDQLGVPNSVLRLSPVYHGATAAGPAMPVRVQSKPNASVGLRQGMMSAVDASPSGSILVISSDTTTCSAWGGLTSTYAKLRGIAGVVVYGAVRDTPEITKLRLPVFSSDRTPLSGYNRVEVAAVGEPVDCGNVRASRNDLVVADEDGVVFIPSQLVEEVLKRATELSVKEKHHAREMKNKLRSPIR
jgi:regulator of RNase E activity RraA